MLKQLKDYIFVKNIIPSNVCKQLVNEVQIKNHWEQHQWQNYGEMHSRKIKYPLKELEVAESFPNQNDLLYPYVGEVLKEYEDFINKENTYGDYVGNCGIHMACPVRFNRYGVHTIMHAHHDHIHSLFDGERKGIPILTLLGHLNDDYEGGEFVFFEDYKIELKEGDILVFPSVFMYPHRVDPVTKGTRYTFVSWAW